MRQMHGYICLTVCLSYNPTKKLKTEWYNKQIHRLCVLFQNGDLLKKSYIYWQTTKSLNYFEYFGINCILKDKLYLK